MKCRTLPAVFLVVLFAPLVWSQPVPGDRDHQPIYRVTVVSRTLPAVNYEHRGGPTMIDFQGTVLLPKAKGSAVVESKRGRIVVDAKFEHLEAPTKYGPEYLCYVLWAITPEGRPKNLGELVVDPSDKAKISATTELQALGLMVTAEPYYAVTTPSDVVVLENVIRPDTIGMVEPVNVKYDLLPRGHYTLTVNGGPPRPAMEPEKISYDRYEAILEVYEAQNAIQIARAMGADRAAPDTISKAESLLAQAQDMQARKQDTHMIVSRAREAAQMAEDARTIATKRRDAELHSQQRQEELEQSRVHARVQSEAAEAQAQAADDRAAADRAAAERERAEADRAAAERAEAQARRAQALAQAEQSRPAPPPVEGRAVPIEPDANQRQARALMLSQLSSLLKTRDTPRGIVATVPDVLFEPSRNALAPGAAERLQRIAMIITDQRGLTVAVEGHTDDRGSPLQDREVSQLRADLVRESLIANGVDPSYVRATGFGKDRPIVSNATPAGREQNRRVEIVISGPSIGGMALWDRGVPLTSRR